MEETKGTATTVETSTETKTDTPLLALRQKTVRQAPGLSRLRNSSELRLRQS